VAPLKLAELSLGGAERGTQLDRFLTVVRRFLP